jgi:hypothetical protein
MVKGIHVKYSYVNQAYFLMWFDSILAIFVEREIAVSEYNHLIA